MQRINTVDSFQKCLFCSLTNSPYQQLYTFLYNYTQVPTIHVQIKLATMGWEGGHGVAGGWAKGGERLGMGRQDGGNNVVRG